DPRRPARRADHARRPDPDPATGDPRALRATLESARAPALAGDGDRGDRRSGVELPPRRAPARAADGGRTMIGFGILIALLNTAPLEVHSATRDVRDCLALADDRYAAATDGGVVFVDAAGVAERPLTILDGLPETRAHVIEPVAGSQSALWIGTEGGLARIERSNAGDRVSARYESASVRAIVEHHG